MFYTVSIVFQPYNGGKLYKLQYVGSGFLCVSRVHAFYFWNPLLCVYVTDCGVPVNSQLTTDDLQRSDAIAVGRKMHMRCSNQYGEQVRYDENRCIPNEQWQSSNVTCMECFTNFCFWNSAKICYSLSVSDDGIQQALYVCLFVCFRVRLHVLSWFVNEKKSLLKKTITFLIFQVLRFINHYAARGFLE